MLPASPESIKLYHYLLSTSKISPYDIVHGLLKLSKFPKSDGTFVTVSNVKIPEKLLFRTPFETAKQILCASCPLVGTSWALTHSSMSEAHKRLYTEMHTNLSHPLAIESLFRIECYATREFVSKIAVALRCIKNFNALDDMIEDAIAFSWNLSYEAGSELAALCQTLDIACVECKKEDASFIIDGKVNIRCCKRDRILILLLCLVPIDSIKIGDRFVIF